MNKNNLSKKVQELIATGTPKQKAQLVCTDYTDKKKQSYKPLLTDEEEEAIRKSLKTDEESREFNKWISVYNIYCDLIPIFGLAYKEYQVLAEKLLGYLRLWEAYDDEETHLNTLYQAIKDEGDEASLEVFSSSLESLTFTEGKLRKDKDGFIEIDTSRLYEKIQKIVSDLTEAYKTAKCVVVVTDEYTKRTRSAAFRPEPMATAIDQIKEDYALGVAPRYSRAILNELKEKGKHITKDQALRAVYPSYDEIETPKELLNFFEERLNYIIKRHGK